MQKVEESNQKATPPKRQNFIVAFISKHNLTFPLWYLVLCVPAFYSELYNYDYYKYFVKLPSQVLLIVRTYNRVESDENHYSFLALLGLCAAFIAEGFWMFNDEVPFIVGSIQFLTSTFFQGVSSLVNVFSERPFGKISAATYRTLVYLSVVLLMMAIVLAEINSLTSSMPWVVKPFWYALSWMMICQIWRYRRTSRRSYYTGLIGTTMYYISDVLFCYRRMNKIHTDWILNLAWISLHNYGNFFMMEAVILHVGVYFERNKKRKEEKDRERALLWWKKQEEDRENQRKLKEREEEKKKKEDQEEKKTGKSQQ